MPHKKEASIGIDSVTDWFLWTQINSVSVSCLLKILFIWEREREKVRAGTEREGENLKQILWSVGGAWHGAQSYNLENMTWTIIKKTPNWLSHPGALSVFFLFTIYNVKYKAIKWTQVKIQRFKTCTVCTHDQSQL